MPEDIYTGRTGAITFRLQFPGFASLPVDFVNTGDSILRVTRWLVQETTDTSIEWADSDSAGYTIHAPGRLGARFDADGKYSGERPIFPYTRVGALVTAQLWIDRTVPYLCWDFELARCTSFKCSVDVDTEEIVGWSGSWIATGVFYKPYDTPYRRVYPTGQ